MKPETILAQSKLLRAVLANCGVSVRNRDDVLQECLIGAVVAVREGRYRPAPWLDPMYAPALAGPAERREVRTARRVVPLWVYVDTPGVLPAACCESRELQYETRGDG
ncbi:hypothetical protein AB3662_37645 [Sorangium cellulosum]|uniref:hypothetical protein n=1 Tax=Sorangium cellulosum TaxID=56 RepID=UPI003D9A68A0